ncbi:hypothetical protein [Natrialba sp. INN-245]|uniref:hypothetical protein n=1 Tax=Natrialba sp. INN-245 TaxID=2690967 RepID=UPI00131106DC|nr:hypothetical protein [Natrialba sp. INN-245]MWV41525.1 hypothetical protein [Natrialba sp. INN-245]
MSAEQQPADDTPSRTEQTLDPRSGVEFAFQSSTSNTSTEPAASGQAADSGESLPARIERTYLRTRVAALESELEASERRRQDVIEQYERILENWRADASSQDGDQPSEGPLGRLLDGWR